MRILCNHILVPSYRPLLFGPDGRELPFPAPPPGSHIPPLQLREPKRRPKPSPSTGTNGPPGRAGKNRIAIVQVVVFKYFP